MDRFKEYEFNEYKDLKGLKFIVQAVEHLRDVFPDGNPRGVSAKEAWLYYEEKMGVKEKVPFVLFSGLFDLLVLKDSNVIITRGMDDVCEGLEMSYDGIIYVLSVFGVETKTKEQLLDYYIEKIGVYELADASLCLGLSYFACYQYNLHMSFAVKDNETYYSFFKRDLDLL